MVDATSRRVETVLHSSVGFPRKIDTGTVRQVTAMRKTHAEHAIAGVQQGEIHRAVRLRPGVRLDIRKVGTKQRLGAIDCELLDHIHMLAPAVIALAGIALCVLVGEQRTGRFENAGAGMILGSDKLDMVFLALRLGRNRLREFGVEPRNAHVLTKHRSILVVRMVACRVSRTQASGDRSTPVARERCQPVAARCIISH